MTTCCTPQTTSPCCDIQTCGCGAPASAEVRRDARPGGACCGGAACGCAACDCRCGEGDGGCASCDCRCAR